MKIIRFISDQNECFLGALNPVRPGYASIIDGDIYGQFTVSSRNERIKRLLAPIEPVNILALGLNYRTHANETGARYPQEPVLFLKSTNAVTGPDSTVFLPKAGPGEVDYEAELALVIKDKIKNVSPEKALDAVLGYTCALDVSARDWQMRRQQKQWARGKSFDTFCPIGPCLVTADEITDPNDLDISCLINNQTYQQANTADMIFNVAAIISHLSQSLTLFPGTLILTGTPSGVGFTRKPPVFLKPGDKVKVIIEGIGELVNRVENEP